MRFVIIGSPRTGSSHLVTLLGSHPEILCNGNVFHPKNVWVFWPKKDLSEETRLELLELRRTNPEALLDRVFAASYGRTHVGFKIFQGQHDKILDRLIVDHDLKKIVLYRRNVLANYASSLAAKHSGDWGGKPEGRSAENPRVRFEGDKFTLFHDSYVAFYRDIIHKLNVNGQVFHLVNYEDINNPLLFGALLRFIGVTGDVSSASVKVHHAKQNSSDILSRFLNPVTVLEFMHTQGLLHWLHEGETRFVSLGDSAGSDRAEPAAFG
jgi:LPS sulfotransferase NodH